MSPDLRAAGWCGLLAGAGLLVEAILWMASGWTPEAFADPGAALQFLATGGHILRWAVLAGAANLVVFALFVVGLAAWLHPTAPSRASATLWFGMVGLTIHLLVPLSHWYGVPALLEAAGRDLQAAEAAWTAFVVVGHEAAGGAGSLFMGLSMLAAGWALLARGPGSLVLAGLGIAAGLTTVLTLFAPATPLSAIAGAAFMPSLVLAILFRGWAGVALLRDPASRLRQTAPDNLVREA